MDEERTAVLRMVAEGKITAEEGDRLMEALDGAPPQPKTAGHARQSTDLGTEENRAEAEVRQADSAFHKAEAEFRQAEEAFRQAEANFKQTEAQGVKNGAGREMSDRLGEKMEGLRQRMEEKMRRVEEKFRMREERHRQRERDRQRRNEDRERRHEERHRRHEERRGFHFPPMPPMPAMPAMPDIGRIVSEAVNSSIPNVGKIVNEAMRGVFVGTLAQDAETVEFPEGIRRLTVKSISGGDLTLIHTTEPRLRVDGRCKVTACGPEEVRIEETKDDVTLHIPVTIPDINIDLVGGGDIEGRLGDLNGHRIVLNTPGGGDVTFTAGRMTESTLTLDAPGGGDITLRVPEDAAFEIAMNAIGGGDIHTELPLEDSGKRNAHSFQGRRNGGGTSRVRVSAPGGGDIQLLKISET